MIVLGALALAEIERAAEENVKANAWVAKTPLHDALQAKLDQAASADSSTRLPVSALPGACRPMGSSACSVNERSMQPCTNK